VGGGLVLLRPCFTEAVKRRDEQGWRNPFFVVMNAIRDLVPVSERAAGDKKGTYAVILSAAKDLLPKASQQVEEILRFAQNDGHILDSALKTAFRNRS
jgi:hypothetical protein